MAAKTLKFTASSSGKVEDDVLHVISVNDVIWIEARGEVVVLRMRDGAQYTLRSSRGGALIEAWIEAKDG